MKILYYHQHFSTPEGATGTRSYEFAQKLIARGHSVTMVCGSYWIADSGLKGEFVNGFRSGVVSGINVIELELWYSNADSFFERTLKFLRYSWQGTKIALKENYNIIFATSTPLTAGIPGIFARFLRKKPFIFEVRDLWPELPKKMGVITNPIILKLMDWLESFTYCSATACIGLSPGIVKGIKNKASLKRVEMIPNGCDLNLVENYAHIKNKIEFVAVFTGVHGIANGLDAVLDAAKYLLEKGRRDIEIHFIGDGLVKPVLQERVQKEDLTNCHFLAPMPKLELFQYLRENASVGLMILDNIPAFYYGTSPNKFFDYLSLGLPVINNYPGWIAELLTQNQCGIAISPDDPGKFADSLMQLKDNPDLRETMGKNGRCLAEDEFDRSVLGEKFVDFLESAAVS